MPVRSFLLFFHSFQHPQTDTPKSLFSYTVTFPVPSPSLHQRAMTTAVLSNVDQLSPSLTTIFTPPSSCRSHWTYEESFFNQASEGLLVQNALQVPLDTACFPSGFTNYARKSLALIYSPGYCPVGYSTPVQVVNGPTTTVICCSTSFSYYSTLTTIVNYIPPSSFIFAGCLSTYPMASGPTTVLARDQNSGLTTTVVSGPITMWGQPIEVAFQQTDLSLYTTSTSASQAQPSSNPVTQAAATATPLPTLRGPTSVPSSSNGLSTGAKAGIGIGVAMVGAFLIGSALYLFWRRRQRARSEEQRLMGTLGVPSEPQEKENSYRDETGTNSQPAELETTVQELDSSAQVEMHDPYERPVAEMESREHLPAKSSG